jgi:hypothetical protein
MSYEGTIKYADGSAVSIQCFEGRCAECPDAANHVEDGPFTGPALDGYYCEHDCDELSTVAERDALDQIAALLDGAEWDADTVDEIARIVRGTGREIRDSSQPDDIDCGLADEEGAR